MGLFLQMEEKLEYLSISSSLQAAESLADPTEYENLFPGLKEAFAAEHYLRESCLGSTRPATDYPLVTVRLVVKVTNFDKQFYFNYTSYFNFQF